MAWMSKTNLRMASWGLKNNKGMISFTFKIAWAKFAL